MSGVIETHTDSEYLLRTTHTFGSGGLVLKNDDAHFRLSGVTVGRAIYNDTDGSHGLVTEVAEGSVTCTLAGGINNYWSRNDQASIYKTATKDSFISKITTDRSAGRKVTKPGELDEDGFFIGEGDIDRHDPHVFGPGQPNRSHR